MKIELGRDARDCLASLGAEMSWMEYESLGHWYSGPMLGDLVDFLRNRTECIDDGKELDTGEAINMDGRAEEDG